MIAKVVQPVAVCANCNGERVLTSCEFVNGREVDVTSPCEACDEGSDDHDDHDDREDDELRSARPDLSDGYFEGLGLEVRS